MVKERHLQRYSDFYLAVTLCSLSINAPYLLNAPPPSKKERKKVKGRRKGEGREEGRKS